MKKFTKWFNSLSHSRQRQAAILFAFIFLLLLAASLAYNKVTIKPGYVPQHIGRTNDSLTTKK